MSGKPRTSPSPQWPDAKVEQLRALVAEGLSCPKIGAIMGLNRNQVIGKIHRLRLRSEHPVISVKLERPKRVRTYRPVTPKPVIVAPAPVIVIIEPEPDLIPVDAITHAELGHTTCRFPVNSWPLGKSDDALFCGAASHGVYCRRHMKIAFVPVPPKRGRPFVVAA